MPKEKRSDLDTSAYNFSKFAATYFNSSATSKYSKRPLKKSLMEHPLPMDEISAQAIWIMILRFMGDMAEAKYNVDDEESNTTSTGSTKSSVMQRLTVNLSKATIQSKEYQKAVASLAETDQQRLIRKTLKRKTKLPNVLRQALDNSNEVEYYHQVLSMRSSHLDKLHFIIGHGILRPALRDEILAQICKQLTNNPYRTSFAKGWILLSLCIGCFPPSDRFEKYLRCFIREGPELYAPFCEGRLDRTLKNGARTQPPSWLELQSTRNKAPITLNVFLMDGNVKKLQMDSASTAKEAVVQLAENMDLVDHFGFSIVISLFDKAMSLGNGREHIMDAISNCEQYAKEQGQNERKAPWKLYLRKEIFTPWYDPVQDQYATHLIYKQVTRGVNFGEYQCRTEKDIAMICALQYYAENGPEIDSILLRKLIPDYVPKVLLSAGEKAVKTWEHIITEAFQSNDYTRRRVPQKCAKEDICIFAQLSWPMMFSRFFEAMRTSGPKLPTDNLVIAVNSTGFFLINETEQVLADFTYPEILSVHSATDETTNIDELRIATLQNEDFTFKCFEAKDIAELVNFMLNNLKLSSKFGVVVQDYKPVPSADVDDDHLFLLKGDLVQFETGITGADVMDQENRWSRGLCNGQKGAFPIDVISVLATLTKPSARILEFFRESDVPKNQKKYATIKYTTVQRQRMYTLRKFSEEHFRPNITVTHQSQSQIIHTAKPQVDELWRHSRDLIKAPLLRKLQTDREMFDVAVAIFSYIMKYMGDVPHGKIPINTELIFAPALEDENLRDEIFCQLMKQLTDNRVQYSEERGWNLIWLATGAMFPTPMVMKELTEFLKTRTHPLAKESLKRVKKTIANGQRKYPPHLIEVEAIQNRRMQIYHKIHFPDNTVEAFEIQSSTRSSDLMKVIGKRLHLKSCDGFSLFVKISDKVFSIPEDDFVFDFISELILWIKKTTPTRTTESLQFSCQYQLFFMKKLWISMVPGRDTNADVIFYYPQEVPKYLNGYYKISKELAIKMAAFLYVVQFSHSLVPMQKTNEILPRILPVDVISLQKSSDWKTQISSEVQKLVGTSEPEAKRLFLESIAQQPTYGSTFFLVKQTNDENLPETILIAINRHGFSIIDPSSKDLIIDYDYSELNFWSSGNTFFQIRFGNMIGASKLLCSTTQGYKIDNLLSSYINHFNQK